MGTERAWFDVWYERLMGWSVWSVSGRDIGRAGRVLWDEGWDAPKLDEKGGRYRSRGAVLIKRKESATP